MNVSSTISSSSSSPTPPPSSSTATASSLGGKKGSKRLIGSLGLGLDGGSFNWEIPPFPGETKVEPKVEEEYEFKLLSNRSTQVEDRDWALLEVEQNGFAFDLASEPDSYSTEPTPSPMLADDGVVFSKEYLISRCETKIDRGTYFEGSTSYYDYDEKVTKLSENFPLAEPTQIDEVLNACHGDYQWAFNLLSQFSEQHFSPVSMVNQINTLSLSDNLQESYQGSSSSSPSSPVSTSPSAEDFNSCQTQNEPFDIASELGLGNLDQQSTQYTFYLDPAFADQLQSSFGQVLKEGEIDEKYLRVDCSNEVARLIHYLWINAYNSQSKDKPASNQYVNPFSFTSSSLKKSSGAKVVNNTHKKEAKANNANKEMLIEPKSAFQEIMDLEMAISLSRKEFRSSNPNQAVSKQAISTKLKRDALKSSFPGLDGKVLEEIFAANVYRLKETIECVEDTLGIELKITPELDVLIKEETGYSNDHGEAAFTTRSSSPSGSVNAGEVIRQIREEITECGEKKKEYCEKANNAFQCKMYAVASYYKGQAQEIDRKMTELRSKVIDVVVRSNPSNSLDLHGIHSNEVITTLSSYLSNKHDELIRKRVNKLRVLIITGRGAHSAAGPRLKPLVIQYLKQKHYRYEIINPGVISVTLNP